MDDSQNFHKYNYWSREQGSWLVYLLPYMEQKQIHATLRQDKFQEDNDDTNTPANDYLYNIFAEDNPDPVVVKIVYLD